MYMYTYTHKIKKYIYLNYIYKLIMYIFKYELYNIEKSICFKFMHFK